MTGRERILAGGIGGALGLYGAYWGGRTFIYEPYQEKKAAIATEKVRNAERTGDLARKITLLQNWQRRTASTLAAREEKAMQTFREDVQKLLAAHNLTADENLTVTPRSRDVQIKTLNGETYTELTLTIDVRGELGQMVDFLRDIYRRPYFVCVSKWNMNAESGGPNPTAGGGGKSGTRGRPSATGQRHNNGAKAASHLESEPSSAPVDQPLAASPAGGPRLKFTVSLTTLVLPENHDAPHTPLNATDLETKLGDLVPASQDFIEIASINPFSVWEPAKPPPVDTPVAKGPDATATKPVTPTPPPPRTKDTLVATVSLNGEPVAYIRNEDRKQDEARKYKLNDDLEGGRIILIHPYGVVARGKPGTANAGKEFFYPLGSLLSERKELSQVNPDEIPGMLDELALVKRQ